MYPKLYYVDSRRVDNVENHKSARPLLPTKAIIIACEALLLPSSQLLNPSGNAFYHVLVLQDKKVPNGGHFLRRRTVLFKDPHTTLLNILGTQLAAGKTLDF